jgi:hypothetical protein
MLDSHPPQNGVKAAVAWRGLCHFCKERDARERSALVICSTAYAVIDLHCVGNCMFIIMIPGSSLNLEVLQLPLFQQPHY